MAARDEMEDVDVVLGECLRQARIRKGLTQNRLHKMSGVSRKHISDAERGANISIAILKRLARTLDLRTIPVSGDVALYVVDGSRALLRAVSGIEDSARRIFNDVTAIRALIDQAPAEAALNEKAEALVREFTEEQRSSTSTADVSALITTVNSIERRAEDTSREKRSQRRRSSKA